MNAISSPSPTTGSIGFSILRGAPAVCSGAVVEALKKSFMNAISLPSPATCAIASSIPRRAPSICSGVTLAGCPAPLAARGLPPPVPLAAA
ncbi:MAG: hypothetical protein ACRYHA_13960, partial [Janthinobacterium lividum]